MSITVNGRTGSGRVVTYNAPQQRDVGLETLTFTVLADGTAGTHRVRVEMIDDAGQPFATLDDLNVSASGQTTIYTYGLFLNASACTTANGWAVTDALPGTQLRASSSVAITAINDNGVEIAGDTISNVVLQVNDPQVEAIALQRIVEMPAATAV